MNHKPRQTRKPETRLGGQITFRGQPFGSTEALEEALTTAVVEAGWRVTPAGAAYLEGLRDGRRSPDGRRQNVSISSPLIRSR